MRCVLLLGMALFFGSASAQETESEKRNHLKLNVTSLFVKNFHIQYERVISKRISVAAGFRYMPESSIPFKKQILSIVNEDDPDTRDVLDILELKNFAFTPEMRIYTGKHGYGRGFYIAPFYRYATFKSSNVTFDYETTLGQTNNIVLSGELDSHTAGIQFGVQWLVGKNITLDWWILGPHIGNGEGDFRGTSSVPLNLNEQQQIRDELEALDIPFTRKTIEVNAGGARLGLNGPWGGARIGFAVGLRF